MLERETSAQSPDEEVGSYGDEGQEEVGGKEGEVEVEEERNSDGDEGDEESCEGTLGSPFILPKELAINNFLPKMSDRVFKELRSHF